VDEELRHSYSFFAGRFFSEVSGFSVGFTVSPGRTF
jgi:hypothetical protein